MHRSSGSLCMNWKDSPCRFRFVVGKTAMKYTRGPEVTFVVHAQEKCFRKEFPLENVRPLDGPFNDSHDPNIETVLEHYFAWER